MMTMKIVFKNFIIIIIISNIISIPSIITVIHPAHGWRSPKATLDEESPVATPNTTQQAYIYIYNNIRIDQA